VTAEVGLTGNLSRAQFDSADDPRIDAAVQAHQESNHIVRQQRRLAVSCNSPLNSTAPVQYLNARIKKQSDAGPIAPQILLLDGRYGV
jgi:hypothetical protein